MFAEYQGVLGNHPGVKIALLKHAELADYPLDMKKRAKNSYPPLATYAELKRDLDLVIGRNHKYSGELKGKWEDRVSRMYDDINEDKTPETVMQRKCWAKRKRITKSGAEPIKVDVDKDIRILAQAAYLAYQSPLQIVLFTYDNDMIAFAPQIRDRFKVFVLSGRWYHSNMKKASVDVLDHVMDMGSSALLKQYGCA